METCKWLQQAVEAIYGTYGGSWQPKDGQYGYACKNDTIYLLQDFKEINFVLPSVNKGQKVVKAYIAGNKKQIKARQNGRCEISLPGFIKPSNQNVIIAIKLNKKVTKNSK